MSPIVYVLSVLGGFIILVYAWATLYRYLCWNIGVREKLLNISGYIPAVLNEGSYGTLLRLEASEADRGYVDIIRNVDKKEEAAILVILDDETQTNESRAAVSSIVESLGLHPITAKYRRRRVLGIKCGQDPAFAARVCREIFIKAWNGTPDLDLIIRSWNLTSPARIA